MSTWPKTWRDDEGNTYRQLCRMGAITDEKGNQVTNFGSESRSWLLDNSRFLTEIPDGEPDQTNYAGGTEKEWDAVSKPLHYNQGGIECIEAIKAAIVHLTGIDAMCTANAIKYLWRWKHKNGLEDLKKAQWYIERLIKENS